LLAAGGYAPLVMVLRRTGDRRGLFVVASFVVAGTLCALYVVAVGGDYIHGRLFLPALFAVCAPVAVITATRRHLAAFLLAPWVLAAALVLRPPEIKTGVPVAGNFFPRTGGAVTTDDLGWGAGGPRRSWYKGPGFYFQVQLFNPNYRRLGVPLK